MTPRWVREEGATLKGELVRVHRGRYVSVRVSWRTKCRLRSKKTFFVKRGEVVSFVFDARGLVELGRLAKLGAPHGVKVLISCRVEPKERLSSGRYFFPVAVLTRVTLGD